MALDVFDHTLVELVDAVLDEALLDALDCTMLWRSNMRRSTSVCNDAAPPVVLVTPAAPAAPPPLPSLSPSESLTTPGARDVVAPETAPMPPPRW